jgi:hypothetical protein
LWLRTRRLKEGCDDDKKTWGTAGVLLCDAAPVSRELAKLRGIGSLSSSFQEQEYVSHDKNK